MKVNAKGIRANIQQTVTIYTLKRGNMQFGKGHPLAVKCVFFDIVVKRNAKGAKIETRRVKREDRTEEAV